MIFRTIPRSGLALVDEDLSGHYSSSSSNGVLIAASRVCACFVASWYVTRPHIQCWRRVGWGCTLHSLQLCALCFFFVVRPNRYSVILFVCLSPFSGAATTKPGGLPGAPLASMMRTSVVVVAAFRLWHHLRRHLVAHQYVQLKIHDGGAVPAEGVAVLANQPTFAVAEHVHRRHHVVVWEEVAAVAEWRDGGQAQISAITTHITYSTSTETCAIDAATCLLCLCVVYVPC